MLGLILVGIMIVLMVLCVIFINSTMKINKRLKLANAICKSRLYSANIEIRSLKEQIYDLEDKIGV